jgi:hypothetical protein
VKNEDILAFANRPWHLVEDADLRWYVFGAQAVIAYGEPRLTADL